MSTREYAKLSDATGAPFATSGVLHVSSPVSSDKRVESTTDPIRVECAYTITSGKSEGSEPRSGVDVRRGMMDDRGRHRGEGRKAKSNHASKNNEPCVWNTSYRPECEPIDTSSANHVIEFTVKCL